MYIPITNCACCLIVSHFYRATSCNAAHGIAKYALIDSKNSPSVDFQEACVKCKHYLLPSPRADASNTILRHQSKFAPLMTKTTSYGSSFITVLHAMQTRSSDENSVRLTVRLSDKRVDCDKTEERSIQSFNRTKNHLA